VIKVATVDDDLAISLYALLSFDYTPAGANLQNPAEWVSGLTSVNRDLLCTRYNLTLGYLKQTVRKSNSKLKVYLLQLGVVWREYRDRQV
jgi:hypothetical protein